MPDLSTQFTLANATMKPVVNEITSGQLDAPTPCARFTVRDLMNHLFHVAIEMDKAARDEPVDLMGTPRDRVETDWRDRYGQAIDQLATAWTIPGAQDGTDATMGLPKAVMAQMSLFDVVVHAWDLARATGQEYRPDPRAVDTALEFLRANAAMGRQSGAFGKAVPIDEGADNLDQLLALSGRDPGWRPS